MVKSYLIGLNVIGVIMLSLLYQKEPITFEYGSVVGVNIMETETVELTINKGYISGPGRLILNFDQAKGIEPTILSSDGGTPSNEDGKLVIRWDVLPATPVISVKFEVRGLLRGDQKINGEFSYTDGSRKVIQLPEKEIHVYPERTPRLDCKREITKNEEGNYDVTLTINPGELAGFGGIKENIPEGFTAKIIESGDAFEKLEQDKNQMIFTWMELPTNGQKITIKYSLKEVDPGAKIYDVNGFFWAEYMIVDNKSVEYYIPTTNKHGFEKKEPKVEEPAVSDVQFRVQIMAAHKVVGAEYFKRVHKFNTEFTVEAHEGWQKYIIGQYPEYTFARDKREELRKSTNLPKPFVTAYNKNQRITVQEALILANQKWVQ